MRTIAAIAALTLVGGVATAAPAYAGYYDALGNYHPTYREDFPRSDMLAGWQLRDEIQRQGYYDVSDLHYNSFSDQWVATAYMDGELMRITVDPYSGTVLDANEI